MKPTVLDPGVTLVRQQVEALAERYRKRGTSRAPVTVRRVAKPVPCWQIRARLGPTASGLYVTSRELAVGKDRITIRPADRLVIVGAGWRNGTLTVCLAVEPRSPATFDPRRASSADREAGSSSPAKEPARQVAATRAIRAIERAIEQAPAQAVADAAAAPSDVEVVVRALQHPESIATLKSADPLGPARLRGLQERERLLRAEGGTWSADEVAAHLAVTRQAVNKRRQQGKLVGLDAGRHGFLYPAWQFDRKGTLADLPAVLEALASVDPWMQHHFMVSRNARLVEDTPLEALRDGRAKDVIEAARAFGDHGAA